MDGGDLGRDLERAVEGQHRVADRFRHGIAVHDHPAPFGVHDQPGAVVVLPVDRRHHVGHVEAHVHERRRYPAQPGIVEPARLRHARFGRLRLRCGLQRPARPVLTALGLPAAFGREPAPPGAGAAQLVGARVARRAVADLGHVFMPQHRQGLLDVIQRAQRQTVDFAQDGPVLDRGQPQQVAGLRHVNGVQRHVEMAGLLVGGLVQKGPAEGDVLARSDRVQVAHFDDGFHDAAPALDQQRYRPAYAFVKHAFQAQEVGELLVFDPQQYVARRQLGRRLRSLQRGAHHQQAGAFGKGRPGVGLGFLSQPQPAQFVVRKLLEGGQQSAAGHRLAFLYEGQRPADSLQRQEIAALRAHLAARVQGDGAPLDVDYGAARGPARGAGRRLYVERVEIVVAPEPVVGGGAVQPRDGSRKDGEPFARIVAHHPDFAPQLGAFRGQLQALGLDVAQAGRIVAEEAEIVHGIGVQPLKFDLLLVGEQRLAPHRAGGHDVPVGQDDPATGIHHEAGSVQQRVGLGVEGPRLVDSQGNDRGADLLQGFPPGGLVILRLRSQACQRQSRCRQDQSHSRSSP